jgi:hypothetical protein
MKMERSPPPRIPSGARSIRHKMSAETIAKRTATRRLRREERLRAVVDALD